MTNSGKTDPLQAKCLHNETRRRTEGAFAHAPITCRYRGAAALREEFIISDATHRTWFFGTIGALALTLSACGGDAGSGPDAADSANPNDEGGLTIETDANSDLGVEDDDAPAEGLFQDGDAGTLVLAGDEHSYSVLCTRAAGEVELAMTGAAATGALNAMFGAAGAPADSLSVSIDGVVWRADSDGERGEILSLDLDVAAGTASGQAQFLSSDGESESGSFAFQCQ